MSLATRLTLFTLAALTAVLAGFSCVLFLMARAHLHAEADARLGATLDTLATAVDLEEDNVEWEPPDQGLPIGRDQGDGQVRWAVLAPNSRPIDLSPNSHGFGFPPPGALPATVGPRDVGDWRVARRTLAAAKPKRKPMKKGEYASLDLVAGLPLGPTRASLDRLALALAGLSGTVWLVCAAGARLLCRRALAPLTRMADAASSVTAETLAARLPDPATGDELSRLCGAFNGVLGRLEDAFDRQRRFTAEASHQMRTPLTAMLGQVEVALRRGRQPEEYRRVMGVVREEASRLRQVVEAMLLLARGGGSEGAPPPERIDLAGWLPEQVARWSGHARAADLTVEPPEGHLAVEAHRALLAQLLDNLIENALKYGDAGTPVRVCAKAEGPVALISVEDAGWGLPAEDLPRLFDPFFRSEQARRSGRPGAGLGLAVVRRIAEALGGRVDVRSEPGRGTCFTLRLPAAARQRPCPAGGVRIS